jgi:hypothetical protein
MNLPPRALALIREYSKPLTPPDWRDRQWICVGDLYQEIKNLRIIKEDRRYILYKRFMYNILNNYDWFDLYTHSLRNGMQCTSNKYGIQLKVWCKIKSVL